MNTVKTHFTRNDVRKAFKAYKADEATNKCCVVAQVAKRTIKETVGCTYGYVYDYTRLKPNQIDYLTLARFTGEKSQCPARIFDKLKTQFTSADKLYAELKRECGTTINFEVYDEQ